MFRQMTEARMNDLHYKYDEETGLQSIIAIQNTHRCPVLGGILNLDTIPQLKCAAVAGSTNNQLLTEADVITFHQRDILYAPDYVINSGGLVFVAMNHLGSRYADMQHRIQSIHGRFLQIYRHQQQSGLTSSLIADQLAEAALFDKDIEQLSA